jgi:hypothetical protein
MNLARRQPPIDRRAMVWIWMLSLLVAPRLAQMSLMQRWDLSAAWEAVFLLAAAACVLLTAGRLETERSRAR